MKHTIKIQSISDIITNSSSEVFICSANSNSYAIAEDIQQYIDELMTITGYEEHPYYTGAYVRVASSDEEIDYGITCKEGDILIESKDDNSIPYGIMHLLEDLEYTPRFENKINNVIRYHLG